MAITLRAGMSSISTRIGPVRLLAAGVVLYVASTILTLVLMGSYEVPRATVVGEIATLAAFGAYVAVGGLITVRRPGNVLGLLLVAYGSTWAMITAGLVGSEALDEAGRVDAAGWVALGAMVASTPTIWLIAAMWLVFPDGRTSTSRDRALLRGSGVVAITATVAGMFATPQVLPESKAYPHPFVDDAVADVLYAVVGVATILFFLFGYVVAARLILRMRLGDAIERRQVGWIAVAVIANITILLGNVIVAPLGTDDRSFLLIDAVAIALIPLAVGVAIMRYGLFDIDVVVSKSVTYLGLAAVISALYAVVVVGPLLVIDGARDGGPGLLLPIVATALVAVLFEPARSRMQRGANRLVYGRRSTPHEVLSRVTADLSNARAGDGTDALARLLTEGTGADRAVVWIRTGEGLRAIGTWSDQGAKPTPPVAPSDELNFSAAIRHGNEELGALSIGKPRTDPITPADRELVADVAAGAGQLLRNIRLIEELKHRADDVRESRRRLIEAHDAERHRLERDLHDGAQQQVVALKVKLGIAKAIAEREEAPEIVDHVAALAEQTQDAVDALREVAHGIYPPLLDAEGLGPALRAFERSSSIPVTLDLAGLGRYRRAVEETVYFCVLETLERARMSGATDARVGVASRNGDLVTAVDLDRVEADLDLTAVSDRLDAAGGTFSLDPSVGRGSRVTGSVPAPPVAAETT